MEQYDKNQSYKDNNPTKELDERIKKRNKMLSLHELVAKNDVQNLTSRLLSLKQELAADFDVDERNRFHNTPLQEATRINRGKSHFEVIEILLNNGADPNARNVRDFIPLWYLIQNGGDVEILRLFLKFKADFRSLRKDGSSLLVPAIRRKNYLDALKFLVQDIGFGVDYKEVNNGKTPLHLAAEYNWNDSHYDVLEFLLQMEADPNAQDSEGKTPLHSVIRSGNLRVFDLFLSYKANFGMVEDILHVCVGYNNNFEVLEKLFLLSNSEDSSLDVNHRDARGLTALHCAVRRFSNFFESMDAKVFKCFLKNGANISAIDDDGATPIMDAVPGMRNLISRDTKKGNRYAEFLLEQSDFSKVVMNTQYKHMFEKPFEALGNNVENLILKYLAKLTFLKILVHPSFQESIKDKTDYKDYFENCSKELEIMSNTRLQNSWINYFNLLVDDRRKLKNYAGNEDLIEDFKNKDWSEMFSIYGDSLKKNFSKGFRRRELFDKSSILLSECLPIFNPNHLVVKDILDCVLSKKDLSKFLCE